MKGEIMKSVIEEIAGLYRILQLKPFRHTKGVDFDVLVQSDVPKVDAIDRVIHVGGAVSPGPVGAIARPWYMHTHQDDNLFVLSGLRYVDLYTPEHGRVEHFEVTADRIVRNGRVVTEGAAVLVWPRRVFHRVVSGADGSISINLATHYPGFNLRDNFNIYELDTKTGVYQVARDGYLDQQPI